MEPFIGQIVQFGGNFAPRSWAFCEGQLMSIAQNTALFSILGTTYGGDGRTTFALPDLRGRLPMHPGRGQGLSPRRLGQKIGYERNTLSSLTMPTHSHDIGGTVRQPVDAGSGASSDDPDAANPGNSGSDLYNDAGDGSFSDPMALENLHASNTGGGQQINNMAPSTCVNFIIALYGTYPSRS